MPRKKGSLTSLMFPKLHADIQAAVLPHLPNLRFHNSTTDTPTKVYETHVTGRFECKNSNCRKAKWISQKISIVIRNFSSNGYNAEVYKQRCRVCNDLGFLTMDDDTYIERVAYRLKKWAGVDVDRPYYGGKKRKPHEKDLCEGCKAGVCEAGEQDFWGALKQFARE